MKRKPFLIPVGLAVASLLPEAALSEAAASQATGVARDDWGFENASSLQVRQPLLASPLASPSMLTAIQTGTKFAANLTVRQETTPPTAAGFGAAGRLTATLRGRMFYWRLTFHSLSTPVVAAVLHEGRAGQVGARLAAICGACVSGKAGVVVLTASQVTELLAGHTYINVGTRRNPHGEVRGQIHRVVASIYTPIPLPSVGGHFSHSSHVSHASHASHASHFSSS
jgi:hypothetical protein